MLKLGVAAAAVALSADAAKSAFRGEGPRGESRRHAASHSFGEDITLSWEVEGSNITFSMTCNPSAKAPLSWCGVGINTDGSDKMYPAEVFWAGIDASGSPYLEDRINTKSSIPGCASTQLSAVTGSSLSAAGVLSVNFTRPLSVSSALQSQGYASIEKGSADVIAAIGSGSRRASACDMIEAEHYERFNKVKIDFLA